MLSKSIVFTYFQYKATCITHAPDDTSVQFSNEQVQDIHHDNIVKCHRRKKGRLVFFDFFLIFYFLKLFLPPQNLYQGLKNN